MGFLLQLLLLNSTLMLTTRLWTVAVNVAGEFDDSDMQLALQLSSMEDEGDLAVQMAIQFSLADKKKPDELSYTPDDGATQSAGTHSSNSHATNIPPRQQDRRHAASSSRAVNWADSPRQATTTTRTQSSPRNANRVAQPEEPTSRQTNAAEATLPTAAENVQEGQSATGSAANNADQLEHQHQQQQTRAANSADLTLITAAKKGVKGFTKAAAKGKKAITRAAIKGNKMARQYGVHDWVGGYVTNLLTSDRHAAAARSGDNIVPPDGNAENNHGHASTSNNNLTPQRGRLRQMTRAASSPQLEQENHRQTDPRSQTQSHSRDLRRRHSTELNFESIDQMFDNNVEPARIEDSLNISTVELKWRWARYCFIRALNMPWEERIPLLEEGLRSATEAHAIDAQHYAPIKYLCLLLGLKFDKRISPMEKIKLANELDKYLKEADQTDPEILHVKGRFMYSLARLSNEQIFLARYMNTNIKRLLERASFDNAIALLSEADEKFAASAGDDSNKYQLGKLDNKLFLGKCYQRIGDMLSAKHCYDQLMEMIGNEPQNWHENELKKSTEEALESF